MEGKKSDIQKLFDLMEKLPVEEKKRRARIRTANLGKYKGTVVINNPSLIGQ